MHNVRSYVRSYVNYNNDVGPLMDSIMNRIPLMNELEVIEMINGPESFTPDLHAIMGEASEVSFVIYFANNSPGIWW